MQKSCCANEKKYTSQSRTKKKKYGDIGEKRRKYVNYFRAQNKRNQYSILCANIFQKKRKSLTQALLSDILWHVSNILMAFRDKRIIVP